MNSSNGADGVLAGIRIVEVAEGLSAPVATRWLAELGADVLKIEPPDGDGSRRTQPAAFASWNRSKLAVRLDLTAAVDRRRLDELLAQADVFVHNWTPAQGAALGLSPEQLAATNPSLIVASVTPYPVGHADAEREGDELLVQARLGIMDEQQALRDGPMFIRLPVAGWGAAFLLAGGIAARLLERERTGRGRAIHTSLAQGVLVPAALYWQRAGDPPDWLLEHTLPKMDMPPHITIFRCADGRWLEVMGGFTKSEPLLDVLREVGAEDLFGARAGLENRDRWAEVFARRTSAEWTSLLWPVGALCMPVLDVGEVLGIEQAQCNGYTVEVDDPTFGPTVQAAAPFEVNGPPVVRCAAPAAAATTLPPEWTAGRTNARDCAIVAPDSALPLAGTRVVDFGSYVAGPFGSQCLADFGADVIKVEPLGGEKGREINQFTGCQRGKRSIEVDLRNPGSREVIERLIASADVVMHNVRLAASRKMGIDEDSVRRINPDAVFAHSSGYGTAGPWSELPAFDPTGFALSGWGHGISGPGRRPSWLRMSAMDSTTGLANFVGVTLALLDRARTGRPGSVTTSLLAIGVCFASETVLHGPDRVPVPCVPVNADQTGTDEWSRIYEAADGWIAVVARTDRQRVGIERVLGSSPTAFAEHVRERKVAELIAALERHGVPVEQVMLDHRDAFFDAELASGSGLVRRVEGTPYGWFENPGGFWSDAAGVLRNDRPIPAIGEHTVEILEELGLAPGCIAEPARDGVVGTGVRAAAAGAAN